MNFDSAFSEIVTNNGSRFRVTLNPPLSVPADAVSCKVSVSNANVWYSFVNLGGGADEFHFSYRGDDYTYAIPKGRYSLQAVEDMMNRAVAISGVDPGERSLFSLYGDSATGRAHLSVFHSDGSADTVVDFSGTESTRLRTLLGYDASAMTFNGVDDGGTRTIIPSNMARFSELSYVTINTNFVRGGYNQRQNIGTQIATITPDVGVGQLIKYRPFDIEKMDGAALIGRPVSNMEFSLLDSSNGSVDLNGQTWNFRLKVEYETPYIPQY